MIKIKDIKSVCFALILLSAGTIYSQKIKLPKFYLKQGSAYFTAVTQNKLLEKMSDLIDEAQKVSPDFCWDFAEWANIYVEYVEPIYTKIYVDDLGITHFEGLVEVSPEDMLHICKGEPISRDIMITCSMTVEPLGDYIVKYKKYNYVFGYPEDATAKKIFRFVKKTLRYKAPIRRVRIECPYMKIIYKTSGDIEPLPITVEKSALY